jgi:hypothetical protein
LSIVFSHFPEASGDKSSTLFLLNGCKTCNDDVKGLKKNLNYKELLERGKKKAPKDG